VTADNSSSVKPGPSRLKVWAGNFMAGAMELLGPAPGLLVLLGLAVFFFLYLNGL
jgi:uncharacterized membrane protein